METIVGGTGTSGSGQHEGGEEAAEGGDCLPVNLCDLNLWLSLYVLFIQFQFFVFELDYF